MADERTCTKCGLICIGKEPCPTCMEKFNNRRNADDMAGEERAEEMNYWITCEIGPELTQTRVEELVGRPVNFFIEVANNWVGLIEEARIREHPENMAEYLIGLDTKNKIKDIVII